MSELQHFSWWNKWCAQLQSNEKTGAGKCSSVFKAKRSWSGLRFDCQAKAVQFSITVDSQKQSMNILIFIYMPSGCWVIFLLEAVNRSPWFVLKSRCCIVLNNTHLGTWVSATVFNSDCGDAFWVICKFCHCCIVDIVVAVHLAKTGHLGSATSWSACWCQWSQTEMGFHRWRRYKTKVWRWTCDLSFSFLSQQLSMQSVSYVAMAMLKHVHLKNTFLKNIQENIVIYFRNFGCNFNL